MILPLEISTISQCAALLTMLWAGPKYSGNVQDPARLIPVLYHNFQYLLYRLYFWKSGEKYITIIYLQLGWHSFNTENLFVKY